MMTHIMYAKTMSHLSITHRYQIPRMRKMKINDKVLHFIAGFVIAILVAYFTQPIIGFALAAIAGASKEMWDYYNGGCPDPADFIVTVIGGVCGSLLWL